MRSTTQNSGLATGLVAAALGAFVCLYGALFAEPAWNFAHAEPRYAAVARGHLGTTVELDALMQALRASPWTADLNRAGFVQMLAAQREGLRSLRATTRLTAARRDLRLGLMASPSDAYAWTRLAVTEARLGDTKAAAAALSMALQIAPAERKLTALHFDLAVALWHDLDEAGRAAIGRRLAFAEKWPDLKRVREGNSAVTLRNRLAAATNN
jgi:tetratricopeptide (TPR) repeat protein